MCKILAYLFFLCYLTFGDIMQIIKYTKKGSNKYELTLKDNTKLILYTDLILKYNLLIIKKIDDNILKEIYNDNVKLDCYYKTIKYLRNQKCTKDIKNYLKDYPSNITNYVISRLTNEGYLDDNNYIKSYINTKLLLSNYGYYKIYYALKEKDLDDNLIKESLDVIDDNTWLEKINNIINTKLKSNTKYSNKALLNKIRIYLKTLGYQDYLINTSLDNIKLDNFKEDEKLKKDYEKLYNKYKNKYDKSKLSYILTCKLYQKGYDIENIKNIVGKEK